MNLLIHCIWVVIKIENHHQNNKSGTTSLSNNAIQNAKGLSRVDKHNYRKYDNNGELIEIVRGSNSLYNDVVKLYKDEFEEAKEKYNSKQTRDDRKINDYFKKISDNSKNDLACEIIIELGDKKYWDTKDYNFKHKMSNVFKEQVNDLEDLIPDFKIASAIIHYDETSPHLHIVGVPIKYKNKNGIDMVNIGIKLKEIRTLNKDTQDTTAKAIGIDQSTYSRYEQGQTMITVYQLIEFAKHYNVSIDYICNKSKNPEI